MKKSLKFTLSKTFLSILLLFFLAGSSLANSISITSYHDKVLGGWLGQMTGNILGIPTEGHFINTMGPKTLIYYETTPTHAITDDDTFNDLVWLFALEKYGLDFTSMDLANEWLLQIDAESMDCGNLHASLNLRDGIMPPLSGHPSFNPYSLYIDAQIEADIWGLISPGMPDIGALYASIMSELMAYSDGEYGARFVASLYSLAFIENDILTMIEKALDFIPRESRYFKVIRFAIDSFEQYPDNHPRARSMVYQKFYKHGRTPTSGWVLADVNGAMVVLSLLYGAGDFDQTLALADQFGLDNDCNAATAGGILGTMIGAENIPGHWKDPLNNIYLNDGTIKNAPTYLLISDIAERTAKIGLDNVINQGGHLDSSKNRLGLPEYKIVTPEYQEPWNDDEVATTFLRGFLDGWEIKNLGWDMSPGMLDTYHGRNNILSTHPLDPQTPCSLITTKFLPEEIPMSLFIGATSYNASGHPDLLKADWELRILIDDVVVYKKTIARRNKEAVWYDLEIPLHEYAGKTVCIEVQNFPNDWNFEAAYWDYLKLEPSTIQ